MRKQILISLIFPMFAIADEIDLLIKVNEKIINKTNTMAVELKLLKDRLANAEALNQKNFKEISYLKRNNINDKNIPIVSELRILKERLTNAEKLNQKNLNEILNLRKEKIYSMESSVSEGTYIEKDKTKTEFKNIVYVDNSLEPIQVEGSQFVEDTQIEYAGKTASEIYDIEVNQFGSEKEYIYSNPFNSMESKVIKTREKKEHFIVFLGFFKKIKNATAILKKLKKIDKNVFISKKRDKSRGYLIKLRYNSSRNESLKKLRKLRKIVPDLFYRQQTKLRRINE